jgi:hypothetical protein
MLHEAVSSAEVRLSHSDQDGMKVLLEEEKHSLYAGEQEEKENREHLRSGCCKPDAAVRVDCVAETRGCRFGMLEILLA